MKTITIQNGSGAMLATVAAHYGPDTITIKRLGWRRLEEADKAHTRASLALMRDFGEHPEVLKAITDAVREITDAKLKDASGQPVAPPVPADPLSRYDIGVLLTIGVVAFDGEPLANQKETTEDLEPDTAEATARAILRLSRPGLFDTEADRKND